MTERKLTRQLVLRFEEHLVRQELARGASESPECGVGCAERNGKSGKEHSSLPLL